MGIRVLRLSPDGGLAGTRGDGPVPSPAPDDVALVLLTSGSTGRAKSVPLTHRNVCASARDVAASMSLGSSDRCLAMWEQYHVGGLVDLLLAPLVSGGVVICTPGFRTDEALRLLAEARPTWFQVVPTTLGDLVAQVRRDGRGRPGGSLRLLRSVAAALPPRLMAEAEETFSVPVLQTFGMTEAGPLITSTLPPPAPRKPGSVGRSCGCEIRIVDSGWVALPPGQTGQVAIRGPNVFSGYEDDAAANAAQFRDGWFLTGDLGRLDPEGDLFLVGRLKQLINRGGEKVNPQEVDDAPGQWVIGA
jgi:acyl-CoA synthetase (AMP-forming)/AMP-acid ligase II